MGRVNNKCVGGEGQDSRVGGENRLRGESRLRSETARTHQLSRWVAAVLSAVLATAMGGCSIAIPSAPSTGPTPSVAPPTFAPPTVVAGHDAKAVAAAPMTFEAGATLSAGVPVGFSDVLGQPSQNDAQTPGPPEWKLRSANVAGQTQYSNAAGCQLAYWTTVNQGPLIVQGDDKASTVALMKYLIPSVMGSGLVESTLPWAEEAGKATESGNDSPTISVLAFTTKAGKGNMASTVWARLLGTADSGLLVSLACPTNELLAAVTPKMMLKLSVAPPSN